MKLLHVNFFPETVKEIRQEARQKGISMSALIRMIIMNHLRERKQKERNTHGIE